MSIDMDQAADAILQAAREASLDEELSDVDVDGDGSSSLSDIEDKDGEQDEEAGASDDLSNVSDEEENDSEAETERLENSPQKFRVQQDVVLSSRDSQNYERTPSKLNNQVSADNQEDEEDDEPLSDEDMSINGSLESPKSSPQNEPEVTTAATSLGDSSGEGKLGASFDLDNRKRKRSIMGGGVLDEDLEEPLRKRTGSIMTPLDEYAIEDDENHDDEVDTSNPISGNISVDDGGAIVEEVPEEIEEPVADEENDAEIPDVEVSPRKRGRKKKKVVENGVNNHEDDPDAVPVLEITVNGDEEMRNGDEDHADNEGDDEAEAALKNEEELEKKRIALEQLSDIEKQFATFRDRLYDERMEQLNREEAMLRQENPNHPEYLAMMQCIDAQRDEKVRIAEKLREFEFQTLKISAVAKRSQILTQYQQEVRELREKKLEELGNKWYDIQHDRRSYAGSVPDYALRFPQNREQQIRNQVAYSNEVSILSGVARYVGFPAAPPMAAATATEQEEDFRAMVRTKQIQQPSTGLPLQELAAIRAASTTSRFKPAEEQFIEQTPWANPQHPSHAHLLQRQASAQQIPRTTSPFSQAQIRRHSGAPISGTFSNGVLGGRISPRNPFAANNHSHTIAPSPLGSRQASLSPQQNQPPPVLLERQNQSSIQGIQKGGENQYFPGVTDDSLHEARREQAAAAISQM